MSLWEWHTRARVVACVHSRNWRIGNLHVVVLVGRIIGVTVNKTIEAVDLERVNSYL